MFGQGTVVQAYNGKCLVHSLLKKNLFSIGQATNKGIAVPHKHETIAFLLLKKERGRSS